MEEKRLIAIGDIHGEYDKLENLLKKFQPKLTDTFVFLGDYIDRGKDSVKTVDTLLELKRNYFNCIFVCMRKCVS